MAPTGIKAGPVTRICHVCGRSYGLSSFDIHLKQCKKLFIAQEELKPASERHQLPKTPPGIGQGDRGLSEEPGGSGNIRPTREMVDEMNRAAQETFNVHGMENCDNCGRTFNEGRLAIHQRSCRPGHAAKRVDYGAAPRKKKPDEVEYGRVSSHDRSTSEAGTVSSAKVTTTRGSNTSTPTSTSPYETQSTQARPTTSSGISRGNGCEGSSRALSGSLATNRSKKGDMQSPLSPGLTDFINVDTLRQELQQSKVGSDPSGSTIALMHAKLDHWEATTLTTLQEIRDLKQLFAQLH